MNRQLSLFDFLFPPISPVKPKFAPVKERFVVAGTDNSFLKKHSPTPMPQTYSELLANHLPAESLIDVCETLTRHKVILKITRKRTTKLGDYRAPHKGSGHRISINSDLNKFSFLVTLIHELAHLNTFEKFKRKVKPHGAEWKNEFRNLMVRYIEKKVFPEEIIFALNNYLENPAASSCTDTLLLKALCKFDYKKDSDKLIHLEDIPEGSVFSLSKRSKTFRKGKKLRKRFLCQDMNSKRKYLVSPVAEVVLVKD